MGDQISEICQQRTSFEAGFQLTSTSQQLYKKSDDLLVSIFKCLLFFIFFQMTTLVFLVIMVKMREPYLYQLTSNVHEPAEGWVILLKQNA